MAHETPGLKHFTSILLICTAITSTGAACADQAELSMAALTAWLEAYGEAWESRDPAMAAALFAQDSSYQVTPYDDAHVGRKGVADYWASVTASQRNVRFDYQPLSVSGNTGIAHWSAEFDVEPTGARIALDGIFVLDFDQNGKCVRLREWWHSKSDNPLDSE